MTRGLVAEGIPDNTREHFVIRHDAHALQFEIDEGGLGGNLVALLLAHGPAAIGEALLQAQLPDPLHDFVAGDVVTVNGPEQPRVPTDQCRQGGLIAAAPSHKADDHRHDDDPPEDCRMLANCTDHSA